MGVEKQHKTFRFSEETLMQIDRIKDALQPFAEDRSHTLRIIVSVLYQLLFTPDSLWDVLAVCQKLQKATSSHKQLAIRFPDNGMPFQPTFGRVQ